MKKVNATPVRPPTLIPYCLRHTPVFCYLIHLSILWLRYSYMVSFLCPNRASPLTYLTYAALQHLILLCHTFFLLSILFISYAWSSLSSTQFLLHAKTIFTSNSQVLYILINHYPLFLDVYTDMISTCHGALSNVHKNSWWLASSVKVVTQNRRDSVVGCWLPRPACVGSSPCLPCSLWVLFSGVSSGSYCSTSYNTQLKSWVIFPKG